MNQFKDVINQAAQQEDHTQEQAAGGKLIPAGVTIGRFVSYIELGPQKQSYNNKPKPDCEVVRIEFELLHPELNKNEGKDGVWYDKICCTVTKKFSGRAKFFKIMKQMTYGRDLTHMSQMLGELFKIQVFHHPTKDDPNKMYASLFNEEHSPNIMAPYAEKQDDLGNVVSRVKITETALKVVTDPELKLFIWSNPTQECWFSIFVEGTYTKDNVEVSKNKWQDTILAGPAFPGSACEAMLSGAGRLPGQDQLDAAFGASDTTDTSNDTAQASDDLDDIASKVVESGEQRDTPANGQTYHAGAEAAQGAQSSTVQSGADALADLGL